MTPLHTAAQAYDLYDPRSIRKLKLLLTARSNIRARTTSGKMPLHLASRNYSPEDDIMKILLNAAAVSELDIKWFMRGLIT